MSNTLRLAIAGLGTVGCGVVDIVNQQCNVLTQRTGSNIVITAVSSRDKTRDRGLNLDGIAWVDDARDLASREDVDVVLELIGGSEGVAKELCEAALANGKHVITANKALIAHHGTALSQLAEEQNVRLLFEAAVAGGIPIIKLLKEGLAANAYGQITGILNGTCNYILSTMETTGRDFDDVLKEAQDLGYAEADPAFDVDGVDASHKLCIISALAYGTYTNIDAISCEGIRSITAADIQAADDLGYKIRLIGVTQKTDNGVECRVHPALLPKGHPIAEVDGVYNAVHVHGDAVGDIFIKGAGAGRAATASAVMSDVLDIARGDITSPLLIASRNLENAPIAPLGNLHGAYYLCLHVKDDAGVLAHIASIFAKHHISVATLIQREAQDSQASLTITTHNALESNVDKALGDIAASNITTAPSRMIRIEA